MGQIKTISAMYAPEAGTKRPWKIEFDDGSSADTFNTAVIAGLMVGMTIDATITQRKKGMYTNSYLEGWNPMGMSAHVDPTRPDYSQSIGAQMPLSSQPPPPTTSPSAPAPSPLSAKDAMIMMQSCQKVAAQLASTQTWDNADEALKWTLKQAAVLASQVALAPELTKEPSLHDVGSVVFGGDRWISPYNIKGAADISYAEVFRDQVSASSTRFMSYVAECNKQGIDWRSALIRVSAGENPEHTALGKYIKPMFADNPPESKPENLSVVSGGPEIDVFADE